MLAGNTTREVESDIIAEQELKTVKRDFGGLNEGIWPKSSLGGCQIRPAAVIFAKGEDGPAGALRRRWTSWSNKLNQLEHLESAGTLWTSCCVKMKKDQLENKSDVYQLLRQSCIRRRAKTKIQQLMCKDKFNQLER
ncbi:hypothetical protein F511_33560 [Dorcoceras hygrometricum]|uniref:Uncharacterized protein n=1 Tax=Dorcoceras hygrometricum TaxID=472368 RepID=A0A2Z7BXA6_9LAMI|nr:hypothetical protein F511_33560 [Dorcoceras hygrometricum]